MGDCGVVVVNGKMKGKAGELEFAALLREYGFEARRGVQYQGGPGSADVVHDVPGLHFEVKRVERLNLDAAYNQAVEDAGDSLWPVVAHRRNRQPWLITLRAEDFLALVAAGRALE